MSCNHPLTAVVTACAVAVPLLTANAAAPVCGTANAALGKPVTASSVEVGSPFVATSAVDGDNGTRWSSVPGDPQWLRVALGTTQNVCGATLNWETAYATAYEIHHKFTLDWDSKGIKMSIDDQLVISIDKATVEATRGPWVFDHPFFIILNNAVGGDWPGPPDASTQFPQRMLVDYVRVYQ